MRRSYMYHSNRRSSSIWSSDYYGGYYSHRHCYHHHHYENVFASMAGAFVVSGIITAVEMIGEKRERDRERDRARESQATETFSYRHNYNNDIVYEQPSGMTDAQIAGLQIEETRMSNKLTFTDELSEYEFKKIIAEAEYNNKKIVLKDIVPPIVSGTVLPSQVGAYDFELDFNDYGKISGEYWIYTSAKKLDELLKFADTIKNNVKKKLERSGGTVKALPANCFNSAAALQASIEASIAGNQIGKTTNSAISQSNSTDQNKPLPLPFDSKKSRYAGIMPSGRELNPGERVDVSEYASKEMRVVMMYEDCPQEMEVDGYAFMMDDNNKVLRDEDLIFFSNEKSQDGAVSSDSSDVFSNIGVTLSNVAPEHSKVDVCFSAYGDNNMLNFGKLKKPALRVFCEGKEIFSMSLERLARERVMTGFQFYLNKGIWKMRAVCAGYNGKLEALCQSYGVVIE